jgi:putative PIN family toxin of toxin-antitoxin system
MSPFSTLPRVVVDVNILIRGVLSSSGASALLLDAILKKRCLHVTSRAHLEELHRVLARPRFVNRYNVSPGYRKRLITKLYKLSALVHPVGKLQLCRDPKDDYLIELALLGKVTYLISEDLDLHDDANIIELLQRYGVQLVHVGSFVQMLK